VPGQEPGTFDGIKLVHDRHGEHRREMLRQGGDVADGQIAGARQGKFSMCCDVAENDGKTEACCFEHGNWLAFVARRQHEHAGMAVQLGQCRSAAMPEQDHARRLLRGRGDGACVTSGIIGGAHQRELETRSAQAGVGGDAVELALLLVDARDCQRVAVRRQAAGLQGLGRLHDLRPIDAVGNGADRHPIGAGHLCGQAVRNSDAAVGEGHARPFPGP